MIYRFRWKLSVLLWWIWLKVTPQCAAKDALIDGVANSLKAYKARIDAPRALRSEVG